MEHDSGTGFSSDKSGNPESTAAKYDATFAPAKLIVYAGAHDVKIVPLTDGLIIGSSAGDGILTIESRYLSRMHGKFVKGENGYFYQDLESENGTYLNGIRMGTGSLAGRDKCPLENGDILKIQGDAFDIDDSDQVAALIFCTRSLEQLEWRTISLEETTSTYYISRHEEETADSEVAGGSIAIPDLPRHRAALYHKDGHWYLHDDNTKYGVFLDNQKIEADTLLKTKDILRIGNTLFFYNGDELIYSHRESSANKLMVHIEERSVWNLFRKKILLENIDLTISPGEMVLILGGSGAGKTTFVNAVMGYEKAKGVIKEGDRDIYRDYNGMKYQIGFVPQQDLLRDNDTVYNTLENAAEMKLPRNIKKEERLRRIDQVLEMFGLDTEKHTLVEKLSGGQRKRLSIAVEFISDPSLFFLDEPDSGLDGIMARSLMQNLRSIADQQKIVLVITHSPDRVSDLFDKVIVLAKSPSDNAGHLAFFGLIDEAKEFFDVDSMEGIVKRVNREDEGGENLADEFIQKFEALNR